MHILTYDSCMVTKIFTIVVLGWCAGEGCDEGDSEGSDECGDEDGAKCGGQWVK